MGLCYNPRVFTPTPERLSLAEWQALQRFLFDTARIDVGAFMFGYPTVLDPAVRVLHALQGDAARFIADVLPRAQAIGVSLAEYGRDAGQRFKIIVGLLDAGGPDIGPIVSHLVDLQGRAATNAVVAASLFTEVEAYLREFSKLAAELDAVVRSPLVQSYVVNMESLTARLATLPAEQRQSLIFEVPPPELMAAFMRIRPLNDQLQAELAAAKPSLEHVMGAWRGIAEELGAVVENVRVASHDALRQHPCLAEIALTAATVEWNDVALDAAAFADAFYVRPAG